MCSFLTICGVFFPPAIQAHYQGKCCFAAASHTYTALYKMSDACYTVLRHLGIMVEGNTHACTRHQRDGAILGNPRGKTAERHASTFKKYNVTAQQVVDILATPGVEAEIAQLERDMNDVAVASPVAEIASPPADDLTPIVAEAEVALAEQMDIAERWARESYALALYLARERNYAAEGISPFVPYIPRPIEVEVAPVSRGRDTWPGVHEDHTLSVIGRLAELNTLARSANLDDGSDDEGRRKRPCSPIQTSDGTSDADSEPQHALSDDDDVPTDCSTDDESTDNDSDDYDHIQSRNPFTDPSVSRGWFVPAPANFDRSKEFLAPRPIGLEFGAAWSFGAVRLPIPRMERPEVTDSPLIK